MGCSYVYDLLPFHFLEGLHLLRLLLHLAGCHFEVHCDVKQIWFFLSSTHLNLSNNYNQYYL